MIATDIERATEEAVEAALESVGWPWMKRGTSWIIAANVLLLGSAAANNAPVGGLSPRTHLPAAPHWTVRPTTGRPHDEHADD